jgi:hypothetical protein
MEYLNSPELKANVEHAGAYFVQLNNRDSIAGVTIVHEPVEPRQPCQGEDADRGHQDDARAENGNDPEANTARECGHDKTQM